MNEQTALLTIDMNRGHLDQEVATLPLDAEKAKDVIENVAQLASAARDADIPVLHVSTEYRSSEELNCNPNIASTSDGSRERITEHNIKGSPGVEVVPEIVSDDDVMVHPKKRYSPFLYGDLDFVLESRNVGRLLITGVNTNTCVQCTCFEAYNRDYEVVVVEDCVDSMYGAEFHEWGLENIDAALGTIISMQDALANLVS